MILSNRLWRLVARRLEERDAPEAATAQGRILLAAVGKRHHQVEIALSVPEELAVLSILNDDHADPYLRFCVEHEAEHNPHFLPGKGVMDDG